MAPRPQGSSQGRTDSTMGSSHLPLPSSSTPDQGYPKGQDSEDHCSTSVPLLAISNMVVIDDRHVDGTTSALASLSAGNAQCAGRASSVLPGPSSGCPNFREEYSHSVNTYDLDVEDIDFLSNHVAGGTKVGYSCAFRQFKVFCVSVDADPYTCSPSVIVKYLRSKYERGASYSTIISPMCNFKVSCGLWGQTNWGTQTCVSGCKSNLQT